MKNMDFFGFLRRAISTPGKVFFYNLCFDFQPEF